MWTFQRVCYQENSASHRVVKSKHIKPLPTLRVRNICYGVNLKQKFIKNKFRLANGETTIAAQASEWEKPAATTARVPPSPRVA